MPRSESPPISPKTVRQPKRSRQSSKSELSVEELGQDDIGYEADIEVLKPDQYEEPESDSEEDKCPSRRITAIDEEITRGMKQLGWRRSQPTLNTAPVLQHVSDVDSSPINRFGKRPEYDLMAHADGHHNGHAAPPAKRRKNRDSKSNIAQRLMRTRPQPHTDSSERTEGKRTPFADSSTGSTTTSEAPRAMSDDEMVLD